MHAGSAEHLESIRLSLAAEDHPLRPGLLHDTGWNAFHFPPSPVECARALLASFASVEEPMLGVAAAPANWVLVTAAGFEFVRANREDVDRCPTFSADGLLSGLS